MSRRIDQGISDERAPDFVTDGKSPSGKQTTTLEVSGIKLPWRETPDFPLSDPWSLHTRSVISAVRAKGGFGGDFFEAGIGDARNLVTAGVGRNGGRVIGVDLDGWRLDLARHNLATAGVVEEKISLHSGDVVDHLHNLPPGEKLTGWGVACLPQAPGTETQNHADGFDPELPSLSKVKGISLAGHHIDDVGLTLNGAFLEALRDNVKLDDFDLLLTMSDRIPPGILEELFGKTGWDIVEEHRTEDPIQQDPDTGVAFVIPFDDGRRFYEKTAGDGFAPIPAIEVEKRRSLSENDGGRKTLNAYHHLAVYHLKPGGVVIYEK